MAWVSGGCGDANRSPGAGGGLDRVPIPGKCTRPDEGCPCSTDLTVKCGETIERDGDTLLCRSGERSCVEGSWGECAGSKTTQIYSPPPAAPGVHVQGLAPGPVDCEDECDPYCQTVADTPDDLLVDDDLVADVTGLTLFTEGFSGSNCPDVAVMPALSTLLITVINPDGTVGPNDEVPLEAACVLGGMVINPSWSVAETTRAVVGQDGVVRVFSAIVGELNVTAQSQTDTGTAKINVLVDVNDISEVTQTVADAFEVPSTTVDPGKTLYPYRDTVLPLDLNAPLVQWQTGGTAANQVRVTLRYPAASTMLPATFSYSKIFNSEPTHGSLETTGAPAWQVPQAVWSAFDRSATGNVAEVVIQRRAGTTLFNEMVIPVRFATESLRGTVYYTQYKRKLRDAGTGHICGSSQPDLPDNYDALNPGGTVCPVGNCTHIEASGASTTRAINMSDSSATNSDPFNGGGGCPVCHSVSANGNVYVAGSRFLAKSYMGTNTGFVNNITANPSGAATFGFRSEAPNYNSLRTAADWDSRGFGYAPLTPNGELALQGFYSWGNTNDGTVASNTAVVSRPRTDGGQTTPMFLVPTDNIGATVLYATTAALSPASTSLAGNVLSTSDGTSTLGLVDGKCMGGGDSILVKNEATANRNGVYLVNATGGCDRTTTTTPISASSEINATNVAARALDNNAGTRWESVQGVDPQWFTVNLGTPKSISRVRIDWEQANARDYRVEVSNDAVTWTTLASVTNMPGGFQHRIDNHCIVATAQYVRIYMTARTSGNGYSIYELDVYGDDAACPAGSQSVYQLTRRADADDVAGDPLLNTNLGTITAGYEVRVTRGTANYGHVFRLTAPASAPVVNVDALTFEDVAATPLTWPMITPTISPDGTKLAYVTGDEDVLADSSAWRKGLTVADFSIDERTVTNKKRVLNNWDATTGGNPIKWPFFEGDSQSLVFVESSTSNFCSHTDPGAGGLTAAQLDVARACKDSVYGNVAPTSRGLWPGRLHSIDSAAMDPAATKTELAKLNDAEDAADADKAYQPTVLKDAIGGYRWVIFTSPRSYGNQINQIGTHFTCGATMLWVAALDDATATTTDRSHPAFFLPGQNVAKIVDLEHVVNERGYLVPSPCKANNVECSSNTECCNANCAVDSVPASGPPTRVCKATNFCSPIDGACLNNNDCCGGAPCVDQKCSPVPSYDTDATFVREYEAECPAGFHPLWGLFLYHLTTQNSSHIGFSAQTAATQADLDAAPIVPLRDSQGDNFGMMAENVDVGDKLVDDDVSASLPFLRVRMTLYPSTNGSFAPILHDWEQRFSCVPAE